MAVSAVNESGVRVLLSNCLTCVTRAMNGRLVRCFSGADGCDVAVVTCVSDP